ncbi:MAG: tRNA pseudouridine(55) synthase TruB [Acidiferrobacteraceae bacterium]|nr:tRNA pseudouridine(55) synthase TruB [Acidiferrobacteraceae bacterium]|tara:strand:+ start:1716 stop:2630 length:915 start_codon:yes stop_codon:yes gene_type:complete
MGRRRNSRTGDAVDGILLLDKPAGITSNAALQKAKLLLNAKKGGHTGSLDPIATGLLPLCFGESTKLAGFFLDSDKVYWARLKLGARTDTGDCEGNVVATSPVNVDKESVISALDQFKGDIKQIPPMYSAVKVNGLPLYRLAREGKTIDREPRLVSVYRLDLLNFKETEIEIELHCSHGFYVRGLAHDLGELLGCGAHVQELRRLSVAGQKVGGSVTMSQLEVLGNPAARRHKLLAGDDALSHIPMVDLSVDAAFYLCRGQAVRAADLPAEGWVRLYSRDAGFLGVGAITDDGKVAPRRLMTSI